MERGVHFMCWYPNYYNFHPSLPLKRIQMIEDVEEYNCNQLIWSCLGGGAIGPQWLEEEAYGEISPRLRIYGHLNDSEFIKECNKKDIDVFGVIFCSQMWEFPVEINEDESKILSLNVLRGEGKKDWLGIRELSMDRYPKIFKQFSNYFPGGLINSRGKKVNNLLDECRTIDLNGNPIHAEWLEVEGFEHKCYVPCKNNPVTIKYFKKLIEMLIDAGVDGIHFDEFDSQLIAMERGGCFCDDCMKGFQKYLKSKDNLPFSKNRLKEFNYKRYLKNKGYTKIKELKNAPLINEYKNFSLLNMYENIKELTSYARNYAQEKGTEVLISQNHFDIFDHFYPMVKYADVIGGEKAKLDVCQPEWYKTACAFSKSKPTIFIEDPYRSIVPEMFDNIKDNKYDLYNLFLIEAFVHGINMSIPYGAWLGNETKDSFWPPEEPTKRLGRFLSSNEKIFNGQSHTNVCLFYPFPNLLEKPYKNRWENYHKKLYWKVAKFLSDEKIDYDVIYLNDGELVKDDIDISCLNKYSLCILPYSEVLTSNQKHILQEYINKGNQLMIIKDEDTNLNNTFNKNIIYHINEKKDILKNAKLNFEKLIKFDFEPDENIGFKVNKIDHNRLVLHILNYNYSSKRGAINRISNLRVNLDLNEEIKNINLVSLDGDTYVESRGDNIIELKNINIYTGIILDLK